MSSASRKIVEAAQRYRVVRVEKTEAPEGMEGKNWHAYVIEGGAAPLTGKKPGTLKMVTKHAEQIASDLNARSGGYSGSPYAPRKGKPAPAR